MIVKLSQAPNASIGLVTAIDGTARLYADDPTANPQSVAIPAASLLGSLAMSALGDIAYGGVAGKVAFLTGNISATRKLLFSQGTGLAAQAPFFDVLQTGDMPAAWFDQAVKTTSNPTFATLTSTGTAALTTAATSWVGPSTLNGIYFSGGRNGFGTITPQRKVEIYDTSGNAQLRLTGGATSCDIFSDGNGKLSIFGAAGMQVEIYGVTNPQIRVRDITNNTVVKIQAFDTSGSIITETNNPLQFGTNNTTRVTIDATGNFMVGIAAQIAGALCSINGSLATAAPVTGTSGAWKLGIYQAGVIASTGIVQLDIGGVLYKLLAST